MSEGQLVMGVGRYFGPSQPCRPTGDSPGIPDGQSAPVCVCVREREHLYLYEHVNLSDAALQLLQRGQLPARDPSGLQ